MVRIGDMSEFGDRLREARRRSRQKSGARWTQGDLAEAIGVERNTVSRWENGGMMPKDPEVMAKLAGVLKVSMEWLIGSDSAAELPESNSIRERARDPYSPVGAMANQLPPRLYDLILSYLERMAAIGCSRDQIDEAERFLLEGAFNRVAMRDANTRTEKEFAVYIDAAWDFVVAVLRLEGKRP